MESRVYLWHKELQDVFNWHNAVRIRSGPSRSVTFESLFRVLAARTRTWLAGVQERGFRLRRLIIESGRISR